MPRLLDLFCGAGGAAVGYARAGFDVVGVDIKPQPRYPFEFHQADAMTYPLDGFDVIHASPPCQAFTRATRLRDAQGRKPSPVAVDLLAPMRARLTATAALWVIENVEGAPMQGTILCGSTFGLRVRRHRIFESNAWIPSPGPCRHREQGRPVGLYGSRADEIPGGGRTARTIEEAQAAIGIDWTDRWNDLKLAIPPAYTEWIGGLILAK